MHQSLARGGAILGTMLLVVLLFGLAPTSRAAAPGPEAGDFVARINGLRSSRGLQTLGVDGQLSAQAQSCAERLARTGSLVHTANLAAGLSSGWTKLAENIGMGSTTSAIWSAFLGSSQHYGNLVDPAFNRVGVGVAFGGGSEWTCHRFMAVSGGGTPPANAGPPAAAGAPAARAPRSTKPAPSPTPAPTAPSTPVVTVPPPPMPGPPPPADSARVSAVLDALRALTVTRPPDPPSRVDADRVATVLEAVHVLSAN
jgi:hypothetical protein